MFEILENYLESEYPGYTIHSDNERFEKWALPLFSGEFVCAIRRNGHYEYDLTEIEDGDETYILLFPV